MGYLARGVLWSFQITIFPIVPSSIKLMPVFLSLGGITLVIALYYYSAHLFRTPPSFIGRISYTFLYSAWQFNYILNHFLAERV